MAHFKHPVIPDPLEFATQTVPMGTDGALVTTKDVYMMGDQPKAYEEARKIEEKQDIYVDAYKAIEWE